MKERIRVTFPGKVTTHSMRILSFMYAKTANLFLDSSKGVVASFLTPHVRLHP